MTLRSKVALIAIAVAALIAGRASNAVGATSLNWIALGDSYSAGVGGSTVGQGSCKREPSVAYSAQARHMLEAEGSTFSYVLAACSGATTDDVLHGQIATVGGADIATMTIGGNDAGFSSYITNCLTFGPCPSSDSVNWNNLYARLVDTYVRVRNAMPITGHLFVLTYPVFFANTNSWPDRQCPRDANFSHTFAKRINEASVRAGDTIYLAIQEANRRLAASGRAGNVHFVDVRPAVSLEFLDGKQRRIAYDPTGICSGVPDPVQSMNGLFSGSGNELTDDFHPTNIGYFNMAAYLRTAVRQVFPREVPPVPGRAVMLAQGPPAPAGYRYAVTLNGFAPNANVSISCRDSVDPHGFFTFFMRTDGSGHAFAQNQCYSGDGPDHWVVAAGQYESNHVQWGPSHGGGPPPPPPPPGGATFSEQESIHHPVNTFRNYHNASGMGPQIAAGQIVQVSCKVWDPYIASVNPDGYWYRIASAPWNNEYYAPANTFLNGDPPNGPYSHNTDFAVPNCVGSSPLPTNTAPTVTAVANGTGTVGVPGPTLRITYRDPECDVTSGTWDGATGSNLRQDFAASGGCSGGFGTATFDRACLWFGHWTEYITLRDAKGNVSEKFPFKFDCIAATATAPDILGIDAPAAAVGGAVNLTIRYRDPECDVVNGFWEGPTGSGLSESFYTPQPTTCNDGVGVASYTRPCTAPGESTEYITLIDSRDDRSQRTGYTLTCDAQPLRWAVRGSGQRANPIGVAVPFTVDAETTNDASSPTAASGTFSFSNGFAGRVTCLSVLGTQASVGGVLTDLPNDLDPASGIAVGDTVVAWVEDGGSFSPDRTSQVTISAEKYPVSQVGFAVPAGFPNACPAPPVPIATLPYGFAPLISGDITIARTN